jgi:hypothetical protein
MMAADNERDEIIAVTAASSKSRIYAPQGWKTSEQLTHSWIAIPISYCNAT